MGYNPGGVEYEFKDSGQKVKVMKVSPLLIAELTRAFPEPKPPMNEVDYGDGKKVLEPNPASPVYAEMLQQHAVEMEKRMRTLLIKRGVYVEWDESMKSAVEELRKFWLEEYNQELDKDDKLVYVQYLCVASPDDLSELLNMILKRSQPTEEAVKAAQEAMKS